MASRKIMSELSELMKTFSNYSDYTEERAASLEGKRIYLQGRTCPAGARPCDPSKRECPDDDIAMEPAMYTSDGFRCYSNVNMNKPRDPEDIKDQHVKIMEFVESAAKLTALIKGKLENVRCSNITQENMCGMKDTCSWANGLCSTKRFTGPKPRPTGVRRTPGVTCVNYLEEECGEHADECTWDKEDDECRFK